MLIFFSLLRVLGLIKSVKKRLLISQCSSSLSFPQNEGGRIILQDETTTKNVIPYMREGDKEVDSNSMFGMRPIGLIRSPYIKRFGTPKQATIEKNGMKEFGTIEIFPEYRQCMDQLERFDLIWAITLMHLNSGFKSKIKPMPNPTLSDSNDNNNNNNIDTSSDSSSSSSSSIPSGSLEVGLFCSRAPHRPNPIALSALRVVSVNMSTGIIEVDGLDLLHNTPVLDIKPYVPAFDSFPDARAGWMDDITSSQIDARKLGYQEIHSKRGMKIN